MMSAVYITIKWGIDNFSDTILFCQKFYYINFKTLNFVSLCSCEIEVSGGFFLNIYDVIKGPCDFTHGLIPS